jgi:hypothetical protein
MKHRHITKSALHAEKRGKGRIFVWNESGTIELTLGIKETKEMEDRFFIDIEDTISDELMGKLLEHFRDLGQLYNSEDHSLT